MLQCEQPNKSCGNSQNRFLISSTEDFYQPHCDSKRQSQTMETVDHRKSRHGDFSTDDLHREIQLDNGEKSRPKTGHGRRIYATPPMESSHGNVMTSDELKQPHDVIGTQGFDMLVVNRAASTTPMVPHPPPAPPSGPKPRPKTGYGRRERSFVSSTSGGEMDRSNLRSSYGRRTSFTTSPPVDLLDDPKMNSSYINKYQVLPSIGSAKYRQMHNMETAFPVEESFRKSSQSSSTDDHDNPYSWSSLDAAPQPPPTPELDIEEFGHPDTSFNQFSANSESLFLSNPTITNQPDSLAPQQSLLIALRLPNGSRIQTRFDPVSDTLASVVDFASGQQPTDSSQPWMSQQMEVVDGNRRGRRYTRDEMQISLHQLGIQDRSLLIIQEADNEF